MLRCVLIVIYCVFTGFNIYSATLIETSLRDEPMLKASHPLQIWADWAENFRSDLRPSENQFHWGIQSTLSYAPNQDPWFARTEFNLILDDDFRPELTQNQLSIYEFEQNLSNTVFNSGIFMKPMTEIRQYALSKHEEDPEVYTFPLPETRFHEIFWEYASHIITTDYDAFVVFDRGPPFAFINQRLIYLRAEGNNDQALLSYRNAQQAGDDLQQIVNDYNQQASEGSNKMFATSEWLFAWTKSLEVCYKSTTIGVILSVLACFIVLTVVTGNILMSVYSAVAIGTIVLNLLIVMRLLGWGLSMTVTTCLIVFIGISFDYIIHISVSYLQSPKEDRESRVEYALRHMGTTVVGGALTTSAAAICMLFCSTDTLNKFGVMLMTTIVTAFLTCTVFFPAFLSLAGPQKQQGNLYAFFK